MGIAIGCDEAGFRLKQIIIKLLQDSGQAVKDYGCYDEKPVLYPEVGHAVACAVADGTHERGILICGTGIGMSIVANKFPGVRAALATDVFMATMAKEHNNANILVLGGRVIEPAAARAMVVAWLDTEFAGGRHQARLDKITALESELKIQAL